MSRGPGISFIGNSVANLVVGAAATGYAVIVPALVVRQFGADLYGTWYLAFQVAAYILLLDLGSQYVVTNEAAKSAPDAAQLATAAVTLQFALAVVVVGMATTWAGLTGQSRLAALISILGIAATASLLASTVRAWFGGMERAHVPAVWLVGARLASLTGAAVALSAGAGLLVVTAAVAGPQLAVYSALLVWARRPPSLWARPDRSTFARLLRSTSPLAVWTVCGMFISGIDIFVVRALDSSEVGRYAIALPLLAIPTGVVTAAITAWIPRAARAEAAGGNRGRDGTLRGTTVMAGALAVGAVPFVVYADEVVGLWAGLGQWDSAATYLRLLYLASCLRFVFLPWSVQIVVRGEQRSISLAPVVEAAVNVSTSVILGAWLGAVGVAMGTLVGAAVAAVIYLAWAIPRTAQSGVTRIAILQASGAAWLPWAASAALAVLVFADAPATWPGVLAFIVIGIDGWWFLERLGMERQPLPSRR